MENEGEEDMGKKEQKEMRKVFGFILAGCFFTLAFAQTAFSQGSFNISLPVPIPPKMVSISNNATNSWSTSIATPDTPVTIKLCVRTRQARDTSKANGGAYLPPSPTLTSAKLYWATNYDSGTPTWTEVNMTIGAADSACSTATEPGNPPSSSYNSYTVTGTIPGQPVSTKVSVYVALYDNTGDGATFSRSADAGMGDLLAFTNNSPKSGPGWPEGGTWVDTKSYKMGENCSPKSGSSCSDETLTFADPNAVPPIPAVSMGNDLDIIDLYVGLNTTTSTPTLFTKLKVQGNISQGSSDLSAANGYVVAVANMKRPPMATCAKDPKPSECTLDGDVARGVFAIVHVPNGNQIPLAPVDQKTFLVDVEKTVNQACGCTDCACPQTVPSSLLYSIQGGNLYFQVSTSAFNVTGTSTKEYYEASTYVVIAGSAVVDARDLQNLKFTINDLTNGAAVYYSGYPKSFTIGTGGTDCSSEVCGNGTCNASCEDSSTCPGDCTGGGPVCGNTVCESGEDFTNCSADCQAPPPSGEYDVNATVTVSHSGTAPTADAIKGAVKANDLVVDPSKITVTSATCAEPATNKACFTATVKLDAASSLKFYLSGYLADVGVSVSSTNATIKVGLYTPAAGGSLDGDNDVDLQDFNILQTNYNCTGGPATCTLSKGDLNGDGKIGLTDFAIFLKNYNKIVNP